MIIKPYVSRGESDPRRAAGVAAEGRMAHYLDRHFRDHKELHVLHDLRLRFEGETAQLDHLVVHPFGVAIVESKSVITSVRINSSAEWERQRNGHWRGMPNPLLQAERQGILLQRLLTSRTQDLLDRVAFGLLQGTFRAMAIDVFAAVSDTGTIRRAHRDQAPNAFKADAVPKAVSERVRAHRKAASMLNPNLRSFHEAPRDFNSGEVLRIAHFLRTRHDPGRTEPAADVPAPDRVAQERPPAMRATTPVSVRAEMAERVACKSCGSHELEAKVGRWGPYGDCRACGTNTAVRRSCSRCTQRVRLERTDSGFAGNCATCGKEHVVLVSPAT